MMLDENSGEILDNKFAKLYFTDIARLYGATSGAISLLFVMVKSIGLGGSGSVEMHPRRKKHIALELNLTSYRTIDKYLKELLMLDVIRKKENYGRLYLVNPEIMFSGNDYQRAKVIIEYSKGKREIKVFKNKEGLYKYLESNDNE